MSMTYTWEVSSIQTKDETNTDNATNKDAVIQTRWKKIGTDSNGNKGEFVGATPLTSVNTSASDFKAISELKESDVLGWIQAQVTGDYEVHVNAQIQKQIDDMAIKNPNLPWAS
ncbi:MAG: hypothetical protein CMP92_00315 [Gammaproteobacteria bacterium]|nr:hypothetical protein [Gammaproteobacteria bacterium]|tara:strand:+ start:846 stop:1187 length:342 start_codon:yes stop_codon:yes gene_type:complete